jgi:hypothetical protein
MKSCSHQHRSAIAPVQLNTDIEMLQYDLEDSRNFSIKSVAISGGNERAAYSENM